MRFPSLALLAERARSVLLRFPWTIASGVTAAVCAIVASTRGADDGWIRAAFVAAMGLPATIAPALLAEGRGWSRIVRLLLPAAGLAALALFFLAWPGIEAKHDAIRYFQLSAVLHLAVAFLPFLGTRESVAFWQFNRRLFLGFLRAGVFSAVLFVGLAIALGALDRLFGVDVADEAYVRIWFVAAFVVNTWIFLATVPEDLAALEHDREYPRALKVFAQYILTPLAFTYLVLLLAYLVKIVAGAEWPSGWIGWLVTSVAVTGLLGFLLVHPLRAEPDEGWIRIYARWLFIGLVPSAVMLLVAFGKRIEPYGLTEPRVLGIVLGLWLLGLALTYTVRPASGIRLIPTSLAVVLLATLYGPLSLTRLSVASQRDRLAERLAAASRGGGREDAAEASAALRFLVEHGERSAIRAAVGGEPPAIAWDSLPRHGQVTDSIARRIMTHAGVTYVSAWERGGADGGFSLRVEPNTPAAVTEFDWMVPVDAPDTTVRVAGSDSLRTAFDTVSGLARIAVGADTFAFDLGALFRRVPADSIRNPRSVPAELLRTEAVAGGRRGRLMLERVQGMRTGDSLRITSWSGTLLVGDRAAPALTPPADRSPSRTPPG